MAKNKTTTFSAPPGGFTFNDFEPSCILIHGKDQKKILEIEYDGTVVWHAPDQASEAAQVFCEQISLSIEHKAGIKKTRQDWEHDRYMSIKKALDEGELTAEKLAEIFKKHEFVRKLAGEDND